MAYLSAERIRELREKKEMTQKELADQIMVSDKTVSKWETGKGLPDVGIIEDLAQALQVSVAELLTGEYRQNDNISANMRKLHFYVCPVCGNVITSIGTGSYTCCGILLPQALQGEREEGHVMLLDTVDQEYHVTMRHEMTKHHYISFLAYVTSDSVELKKLYPEQDIEVRFRKKGHGELYAYCNRHGLFRMHI